MNHSIFLQKLNFYGIRGVAEKWIENYLSDRKQFVKICDSSSNALGVSCGVPQGSVLGPRLFILSLMIYAMYQKSSNVCYLQMTQRDKYFIFRCKYKQPKQCS